MLLRTLVCDVCHTRYSSQHLCVYSISITKSLEGEWNTAVYTIFVCNNQDPGAVLF